MLLSLGPLYSFLDASNFYSSTYTANFLSNSFNYTPQIQPSLTRRHYRTWSDHMHSDLHTCNSTCNLREKDFLCLLTHIFTRSEGVGSVHISQSKPSFFHAWVPMSKAERMKILFFQSGHAPGEQLPLWALSWKCRQPTAGLLGHCHTKHGIRWWPPRQVFPAGLNQIGIDLGRLMQMKCHLAQQSKFRFFWSRGQSVYSGPYRTAAISAGSPFACDEMLRAPWAFKMSSAQKFIDFSEIVWLNVSPS